MGRPKPTCRPRRAQYLRDNGLATSIALWGRSMGAACSIMHAARDPGIAGIIADSPFASLEQVRGTTKPSCGHRAVTVARAAPCARRATCSCGTLDRPARAPSALLTTRHPSPSRDERADTTPGATTTRSVARPRRARCAATEATEATEATATAFKWRDNVRTFGVSSNVRTHREGLANP